MYIPLLYYILAQLLIDDKTSFRLDLFSVREILRLSALGIHLLSFSFPVLL